MLAAELLEVLRCPMDPRRSVRLTEAEDHLACPSCGLRFAIKDGFPNMIVEEAELPAGCTSLDALPAKHAASA